MDKVAMPEGKYLASVKLGPKGQIVVPKVTIPTDRRRREERWTRWLCRRESIWPR